MKRRIYKRYRTRKKGGQRYWVGRKQRRNYAFIMPDLSKIDQFDEKDRKRFIYLIKEKRSRRVNVSGELEYGPGMEQKKEINRELDSILQKVAQNPKRKNYGSITAWPYGRGQQRFKKITKKGIQLESTGIPIDTGISSKSHKSPITEEEVKEVIEQFTPKELGTTPRNILITERGGLMTSYADTYGEAFKHGGIKLYSKPFKELKKKESYFIVDRGKFSETELKDKYKYDVIPHEIAHHRLGHTSKTSHDEIAADQWAAEWRQRRGIKDQPYYRKGGPRIRPFI